MEEYKVYEEASPIGDGTQKVYRFPNGYGASVIRFTVFVPFAGVMSGSYGSLEGKWELALIKFNDADDDSFVWVYEHGYDDVIGDLTDEEVESHLAQIKGIEVAHG